MDEELMVKCIDAAIRCWKKRMSCSNASETAVATIACEFYREEICTRNVVDMEAIRRLENRPTMIDNTGQVSSEMTEHDRARAIQAAICDRNDVDSLRDAVVGLQSTDHPSLYPLYKELSELYDHKLKEVRDE